MRPTTNSGTADGHERDRDRHDQLGQDDLAAGQRLGQDVGQRAVVDLGAEHAGADDERDDGQHDGEAEADDDRLAPVVERRAERRRTAAASPTTRTGSGSSSRNRRRPNSARAVMRAMVRFTATTLQS